MNHHQQQRLADAARALNTGEAQRAVTLCQQVLEEVPGQLDCQHILGVALIAVGQVEHGSAILTEAQQAQPANAEILYNHASALLNTGHCDQALELFNRVLLLSPEHVPALNNRGSALLELGDLDAARSSYAQALKLAPEHSSSWFNLGNLEVLAGQIDAARDAYLRAIAIQPDYPQAQGALGQLYLSLGLFSEAVTALERACKLQPQNADSWRHLAQALAGVSRFDAALGAARKATDLAPDSADAWNGLGAQLTSLGALEESEQALRRALQLNPDLVVAWANLAALMELANRSEDCLSIVSQGLERWPEDAGLLLARARLLRRSNQLEDVLQALDQINLEAAGEQHRREAHFLYGQVLSSLKQYQRSFEHYQCANRLSAEQWQRGDPSPDAIVPAMDGLAAAFTSGFVAGWPDKAPDEPMPAFVVSFQRSGTTLLDTMLGAHPDVLVMEELPVLNALIRQIGAYPAALGQATPEQLSRWRGTYWKEVKRLAGYEPQAHQRLIDKSPLHTMHLGLIQRLFPAAPIVFVLRHPLDVVLSCFMQDFTLSGFMLRYTTIEGVAEVYRKVMDLYQQYQQLLPLNTHEVRYESLVVEPEAQMRDLLSFLGLSWNRSVLDHTSHAKSRGLINTPSYHQVTQPLYSTASYRWRHFRQPLAPVMEVMAPWCDTFGYSLD